MITDYFDIAWKNLRKRKLRSWLTIVGIVISVATIFTLISMSIGLQNAVKEQFENLGGDKFFIQPKGQLGPPQAGGAVQLTTKDIEVIDKVSGVKRTAYFTIGNAEIEFDEEKRFFSVYGLPPEFMDLYVETGSFEISEGRLLKNNDRGKIVIGNHYKTRNIFSKNVKAGDKFLINGKEFEVAGIFESVGNPDDDRSIIMPRDDFIELFNSGERVDAVMIQVDEGAEVRSVAEAVEKKLRNKNTEVKEKDCNV